MSARQTHKQRAVEYHGACFSIISSLWVWLYEQLVPDAYYSTAHGHNVDELHKSVARLHDKRRDLHSRLVSWIADARRCRRDPKVFRNKVYSIRRLKSQLDKMDSCIATIESNLDQVLHSDITRDIVESFKKSMVAIKSSGTQLGPPDSVNDLMEEMQNDLQSANEVTDTVYSRQFSLHHHPGCDSEPTDEELMWELDQMLLSEDDGERSSNSMSGTAAAAAAAAAGPVDPVISDYPLAPAHMPLQSTTIGVSSVMQRRVQASSSSSSSRNNTLLWGDEDETTARSMSVT